MTGSIVRGIIRHGAHFFAQIGERHLRAQPAGILRNLFHRSARVVADQIDVVAQRHERLEVRAASVTGKFKITGAMLTGKQRFPQGAEIAREISAQSSTDIARPLVGSAMICSVGRWLPDTCTRTRSKPMASIAGVINLAMRSANIYSFMPR